MAKKLTALSVAAIRPGPQRREIPDAGCAGLYLIVQPGGHRSWCVRYRHQGRTRKLTLGDAAVLPLAAARKAATDALHVLAGGVDPAAAKESARIAAEVREGTTLRAVAELYLQREEVKPADKRLRTIGQRRATFERLIFPTLGSRSIGEIRRSEVVRLLDEVEASRGGRMADEVLGCLRILFDWHAKRDDDFRTPLARGMTRTTPASRRRNRVLDDTELRAVWLAADKMPGPFGPYVQLLLLTATRRCEAANMRWSELNGNDWTIPGARYKNKADHLIPLSGAAQAILAKVPRIADCGFVFTNDGQRPISSFSVPKGRLDQLSGVSGWRLHDLRRVARTLLSRAGAANDIAEMCLGHTLGGLRATYDQHSYHAEKKHAFEALAAQIERIVDPQPNVVPLRS
jgi:integrase